MSNLLGHYILAYMGVSISNPNIEPNSAIQTTESPTKQHRKPLGCAYSFCI